MHVTEEVHIAGRTVGYAAILDEEVSEDSFKLVALLDKCQLQNKTNQLAHLNGDQRPEVTYPHATILLILNGIDDSSNPVRQFVIKYWQTAFLSVDLVDGWYAKDRLAEILRDI
jgi:hypothetical protein